MGVIESALIALFVRLAHEAGPKAVDLVKSWLGSVGASHQIQMDMPDLWEVINRVAQGGDLNAQSDLDVELYDRVKHLKAGQPNP